ncbi:beta-ketoacyl synthase N-terminal-like domain-containing protein [Streptomyces sp. NPDC050516]|uniref:beta-ketoacyl synthase N-terminal-like domain-containing protein n=1 Tax=Streptomyces sp. NPDC050516 TaxID=3365621 RepID=UPI0037B49621
MDMRPDLMDEREVLTRFKAGSLERGQAVRILTTLMSVGVAESVPTGPARTAPPTVVAAPEPERTAAPRLVAHTAQDAEEAGGADAETATDGYAVVGIAGRYPLAADLLAHWQNLRDGRDTSSAGPDDRPSGPPLATGQRGHFLSEVAEFDAEFFGLTPAEAALMDPQARLFQETVWEALEDAGCTGSRLDSLTGPDGRPRAVGVFAGVGAADYALLAAEGWARGHREMPSSGHRDLAVGLAARLRLSGPAQAVDSAGTSALDAVHLAVGALRRGECAAAVAGGVELLLHASRGRDAAGEGVGAIVLKPLARALADGDQVHAVLRETVVGGPARPVPAVAAGRATVVRETHETTSRRIGDAGAAIGIAALTSAVLQLRAGVLAPTGQRTAPVAWPRARDERGRELPRTAVVELAAAQGLGIVGVLEEFLPPADSAARPEPARTAAARDELVLLSAPTPAHLTALAARLADWLAPAAPGGRAEAPTAPPALGELARTLRAGRAALPCRLALTVKDLPQLIAFLGEFVADPGAARGGRIRGADLRAGAADPYALAGAPETRDYLAALWRGNRLEQLTRLWLSGLPIDWAALEQRTGAGAMVVPLPPSVFLRRPMWLGDARVTGAPKGSTEEVGAAMEPTG